LSIGSFKRQLPRVFRVSFALSLFNTMTETIQTPLTKLFGIKYPILQAGMAFAAGPELAAAVTNAGGLGVIGGLNLSPALLRKQINSLKSNLRDKSAPFGVDLLLPQVGGSARKTNVDYTEGKLAELIDIIIEEKTKLFVVAVGVPPRWVVDKLHAANIPVMNMIGSPKHVQKALDAGVDIICAQGGEAGGHTGDLATSVLIPIVVNLCKGKISSLTGGPIYVVAAGGIFDGRGLAAALCWGAQAVWVGTRFVCAEESSAHPRHQKAIMDAGYHATTRTVIYTGRPLRTLRNELVIKWEDKQDEIKKLVDKGIIPVYQDAQERIDKGEQITVSDYHPLLMGQAAGAITDVKPAATIIQEMIADAIKALKLSSSLVVPLSKL